MEDMLATRAMLDTLVSTMPTAVINVNADGRIGHILLGRRRQAASRRLQGRDFLRLLRLVFGPAAVCLTTAYETAAAGGQPVRLACFAYTTRRGMTEYLEWHFAARRESSTMVVCVRSVTEAVSLEQEFAAATQQNEAVSRDFLAAMSKLDFRLMELDQAHKKLAALYRITSSVQERVDEQAVLDEIVRGVTGELGYSCAAILLLDEDKRVLRMKAHRGYTALSDIPYAKGVVWQAALARQMIYIPDVRTDPRHIKATAEGVSEVAVPLIYGNKVIGVLDVETSEDRPLHPYDRDLLGSLAGQVALTIAHARHVRMMQTLAITDELTGLYNYRYFCGQLEHEFKRAKRYKRPLSLIMMDIDDFKRYNDNNGHHLGNHLLAELADLMRTACRDVDCLVRYGGEEFAIIVPETGLMEAYMMADRICSDVAGHPFRGREGQPQGALTVSGGVACYPHDAASAKELLEHADQAMYNAKGSGKNRALAYNPPLMAEVRAGSP